MGRMRGQKGSKKPSALSRRRMAVSGRDTAVILNCCSQLQKAVALTYSNRNTAFLYCSVNKKTHKRQTNQPY